MKEMDGTRFFLQWEEHTSHLSNRLGKLLEQQNLVDLTLMCNTHTIRVHRAVLAACSPYFETILQRQLGAHPLIVLKDMQFTVLKSLIEFMYSGETNVSASEVGPLLEAAKFFQVKGLSSMTKESLNIERFGSTSQTKTDNEDTVIGTANEQVQPSELKPASSSTTVTAVVQKKKNDVKVIGGKTFQMMSKIVPMRIKKDEQISQSGMQIIHSGGQITRQGFQTFNKVNPPVLRPDLAHSESANKVHGLLTIDESKNTKRNSVSNGINSVVSKASDNLSPSQKFLQSHLNYAFKNYIPTPPRRRGRPPKIPPSNIVFKEKLITDAEQALQKEAEVSFKALKALSKEMKAGSVSQTQNVSDVTAVEQTGDSQSVAADQENIEKNEILPTSEIAANSVTQSTGNSLATTQTNINKGGVFRKISGSESVFSAESEAFTKNGIVYQVESDESNSQTLSPECIEVMKKVGLPTDAPILLDAGNGQYITVNEEVFMSIISGNLIQIGDGHVIGGDNVQFIVQEVAENQVASSKSDTLADSQTEESAAEQTQPDISVNQQEGMYDINTDTNSEMASSNLKLSNTDVSAEKQINSHTKEKIGNCHDEDDNQHLQTADTSNHEKDSAELSEFVSLIKEQKTVPPTTEESFLLNSGNDRDTVTDLQVNIGEEGTINMQGGQFVPLHKLKQSDISRTIKRKADFPLKPERAPKIMMNTHNLLEKEHTMETISNVNKEKVGKKTGVPQSYFIAASDLKAVPSTQGDVNNIHVDKTMMTSASDENVIFILEEDEKDSEEKVVLPVQEMILDNGIQGEQIFVLDVDDEKAITDLQNQQQEIYLLDIKEETAPEIQTENIQEEPTLQGATIVFDIKETADSDLHNREIDSGMKESMIIPDMADGRVIVSGEAHETTVSSLQEMKYILPFHEEENCSTVEEVQKIHSSAQDENIDETKRQETNGHFIKDCSNIVTDPSSANTEKNSNSSEVYIVCESLIGLGNVGVSHVDATSCESTKILSNQSNELQMQVDDQSNELQMQVDENFPIKVEDNTVDQVPEATVDSVSDIVRAASDDVQTCMKEDINQESDSAFHVKAEYVCKIKHETINESFNSDDKFEESELAFDTECKLERTGTSSQDSTTSAPADTDIPDDISDHQTVLDEAFCSGQCLKEESKIICQYSDRVKYEGLEYSDGSMDNVTFLQQESSLQNDIPSNEAVENPVVKSDEVESSAQPDDLSLYQEEEMSVEQELETMMGKSSETLVAGCGSDQSDVTANAESETQDLQLLLSRDFEQPEQDEIIKKVKSQLDAELSCSESATECHNWNSGHHVNPNNDTLITSGLPSLHENSDEETESETETQL